MFFYVRIQSKIDEIVAFYHVILTILWVQVNPEFIDQKIQLLISFNSEKFHIVQKK